MTDPIHQRLQSTHMTQSFVEMATAEFTDNDLFSWIQRVAPEDILMKRKLLWATNQCQCPFYDVKVKVAYWRRQNQEDEDEPEQVFLAHKLILAMSSQVFGIYMNGISMEKGAKQTLHYDGTSSTLNIVEFSPSLIKLLLEFIYIDDIGSQKLTIKDIWSIGKLLYASYIYSIPRLSSFCKTWLEENLNCEHVICIFQRITEKLDAREVRSYQYSELLKYCLLYILRLKNVSFIAGNNFLRAEEFTIYSALKRWAKEECRKVKLTLNIENYKRVLMVQDQTESSIGLLGLVRFHLMDSISFTSHVDNLKCCLLPNFYKKKLYEFYGLQESHAMDIFSSTHRNTSNSVLLREHVESAVQDLTLSAYRECHDDRMQTCAFNISSESSVRSFSEEFYNNNNNSNNQVAENQRDKVSNSDESVSLCSVNNPFDQRSDDNDNIILQKNEREGSDSDSKPFGASVKCITLYYNHLEECEKQLQPIITTAKTLKELEVEIITEQNIYLLKNLNEVGSHIQQCSKMQSAREQQKYWKSYLWNYISKLTLWDHPALYHTYKKFRYVPFSKEFKDFKTGEENIIDYQTHSNIEDRDFSELISDVALPYNCTETRNETNLDFQHDFTQNNGAPAVGNDTLISSKSVTLFVPKFTSTPSTQQKLEMVDQLQPWESVLVQPTKRPKLELDYIKNVNRTQCMPMYDKSKPSRDSPHGLKLTSEVSFKQVSIDYDDVVARCSNNQHISIIRLDNVTIAGMNKRRKHRKPIYLPYLNNFMLKANVKALKTTNILINSLREILSEDYIFFSVTEEPVESRLSELWRHSVTVKMEFNGMTVLEMLPNEGKLTINYAKHFTVEKLSSDECYLNSLSLANCSLTAKHCQWVSANCVEYITELCLYSVKNFKHDILKRCKNLNKLFVWAPENQTPKLSLDDINSSKLRTLAVNNYMIKFNPQNNLVFQSVEELCFRDCVWDPSLVEKLPQLFPKLRKITLCSRFCQTGPDIVEVIRGIQSIEEIWIWNLDLKKLENVEFKELKDFLKTLNIRKYLNKCNFKLERDSKGEWKGFDINVNDLFKIIYDSFSFVNFYTVHAWSLIWSENATF